MSKQEKEKLVAGIAGYKHEQEVIKRILRRHKKLSAREFDRIFGDSKIWTNPKTGVSHEIRLRPKFRFMCADGKAFILGDVFSAGDLSRWIHLVNIMGLLGIVEVTMRCCEITYSLKEKGGD